MSDRREPWRRQGSLTSFRPQSIEPRAGTLFCSCSLNGPRLRMGPAPPERVASLLWFLHRRPRDVGRRCLGVRPSTRSHSYKEVTRKMTFESLGLSPKLLRAVAEEGYAAPTPIQLGAIPPVLEGRDLVGSAQTGTGKTAAFMLPILHRLSRRDRRGIRVLVLEPTRELAEQVLQSARTYGRYLEVTAADGQAKRHSV